MKKIAIAVCLQIVAGITASLMPAIRNGPNAVVLLFIATGFSQCALLAMWATIAHISRGTRALGVACGVLYLWVLVVLSVGPPPRDLETWMIGLALVACPLSLLAATLIVARKWRRGFDVVRVHGTAHDPNALQFSLQHILTLVFAVGVVLTVGRLIRAMQVNGWIGTAIVCLVLAACVVETSLAALWASLSSGRNAVRLVVAVGLAVLTGLIPPFYFEMEERDYYFVPSTAVASQVLTIATLLVVRSCGFRLVQRQSSMIALESAGDSAAHPLD